MAIDTEELTPTGAASNKGSNKKIIIIVVIVVCVLFVLGIVGTLATGFFAKKAVQTAVNRASDGKVNLKAGNNGTGEVTIKGDNGETTKFQSTTKLPAEFPTDVPRYKDAGVVSVVSSSSDGKKFYSVAFDTKDDTAKVAEYFNKALAENGWSTVGTYSANSDTTITGVNKSKMLYALTSISKDESSGKTTIHLSVQTNYQAN